MAGIEIITFGCRLNAFESDVIHRAAVEAALADAVIVNTCAVTAEAERQARQAIRRARRQSPEAQIIVTGCAATIAPERYSAMAEVDAVLDNDAKLRPESYHTGGAAPHPSPLPAHGERERGGDPRPVYGEKEGPAPQAREGEGHAASLNQSGRARAYLQVQQGCDHCCTFCIIPYGRGPSRSVPANSIAERARALVAAGHIEIVLTGVDLTAYGADLPGQPTLGQMAQQLLATVPELKRLRLSSLDPVEIDDDLWRLFGSEERVMPHLHLSLQSGDDLILKRMKRRHARADAIAAARRAKALRPETALGADLIAGFPTESDDMFRRSLDLVAECGLAFVHVFPYSARDGTPAARMPQVPPALVRERAARLRAAGAAALAAELGARVGSTDAVLVEQPGCGRTGFYAAVRFAGGAAAGSLQRMRFIDVDGNSLVGVPV